MSSPRSSPAPPPSPRPSRNRLRRPATSPPARPIHQFHSPTEAPKASSPRASRRISPPPSLDTQGNPITGLTLTYQSTNPIDITADGSGSITAAFPGVASVYAVCEPPICNPAPINEFGLNGTGLSISSNPVSIIVPGTTSDFVWFGAPGQSQYFCPIELLTGNPGSTVRLPYVPNSMVMDQAGNNLYFGSSRELMIYSTANNSSPSRTPRVPGVVLAVSPNGNQVLINDQIAASFISTTPSGGTSVTFGGLGVAAAWTPDSNTLYIVDSARARRQSHQYALRL